MLIMAAVLRWLVFPLDSALGDRTALSAWWLHSGTGDDARNLLSTLVSALITMASVMFSITMVVLSLAANQFGSRLVRTYMADIRTQLALGTFMMTVVYCLLVLRTVSKDMPASEVPHVAVTLGLVLALLCILTLLFFLHVIARSMVADDVIRRVARELEDSIDELPEVEAHTGRDRPEGSAQKDFGDAQVITSCDEGYVQAIDYDALAELAAKNGIEIQVRCSAGAFMCKDGWLAAVRPARAALPEIERGIQDKITIGDRRTPTQDLEFSIRHLVDIALRALSPGINDPHTAIAVIDRMRGALSRLMGKRIPTTNRMDESGRPRVFGHNTGHADIFNEAFNEIRQAGAAHPAVIIHLLGALDRMAEHVRLPEQREALLEHVALVSEAGLNKAEQHSDRAAIEEKRALAERKLHDALQIRLASVPKSLLPTN